MDSRLTGGQHRFISSNKCSTCWRMLLIERRLCMCVGTGYKRNLCSTFYEPKTVLKIKSINKKGVPPVARYLGLGLTLGQTVDSLITLLCICWRDTLPTVYLTISPNETQVVTFIPLNLVLFSLWSPGPCRQDTCPVTPAQPCGGFYREASPDTAEKVGHRQRRGIPSLPRSQ